jgi:hypothetical protein
MADFLEIFSLTILAVMLLSCWLASRAERGVAAHLHSNHPEVWARIAPSEESISIVSSPLIKFIWRREYLGLRDAVLTGIGGRARMLQRTTVASLGLFIASDIVQLLCSW